MAGGKGLITIAPYDHAQINTPVGNRDVSLDGRLRRKIIARRFLNNGPNYTACIGSPCILPGALFTQVVLNSVAGTRLS